MTIEDGSFNYRLAGFSLVLAMVASYALELAGRVTSARGKTRLAWLGGGAIAMGAGFVRCNTASFARGRKSGSNERGVIRRFKFGGG